MTPTPHDALFRAVFSQLEHATGALRTMLPAALSADIDWPTLELLSGSFVSDELAARVTDLVFRARLLDGSDARLCLLLEHQSRFDRWMPLRLLDYTVEIWNAHRRDSPDEPLPVVVPIVLHHSERGWNAPANLDHLLSRDAMDDDQLTPYVPSFDFVLEDLAKRESQELHDNAMTALGQLAFWCLKRARDGQAFLAELAGFADTYHSAMAHGGSRAVSVVMRYIQLVTDLEAHVVAEAMEENVSTEAKQEYLTSGQRLLAQGQAQGLAQGEAQGRVQGRRTLLVELVETKFGPLTAATRARFDAGAPDDIARWAKRVLSADTLEAVFA